MMTAARKHNGLAQRAAKLQARAMGKERLSPWDSRAPAPLFDAGVSEQLMTFEEAVELIDDAFSEIDKSMGEFVRKMAKNGWIEEPQVRRNALAPTARVLASPELRVFT